MKKVLFLCTGNYFRSRFAEEYFSYLVRQKGEPIVVESRGLARNITPDRNPGPISQFAIKALIENRVELNSDYRYPISLDIYEAIEADYIVAMDGEEHRKMVIDFFPELYYRTDFWDIKDIGEGNPVTELIRLRNKLDLFFEKIKVAESIEMEAVIF